LDRAGILPHKLNGPHLDELKGLTVSAQLARRINLDLDVTIGFFGHNIGPPVKKLIAQPTSRIGMPTLDHPFGDKNLWGQTGIRGCHAKKQHRHDAEQDKIRFFPKHDRPPFWFRRMWRNR